MLYLSKDNVDQLYNHSKTGTPCEVCGILAGTLDSAGSKKEVKKVYRMINADKSAETFLMDPTEQLKVMKEIRGEGLEMVGIYHSHPATKAYPSEHDVRMAFYPEVSYVIVSLEKNEEPYLRSFIIKDGNIEEEEVTTE